MTAEVLDRLILLHRYSGSWEQARPFWEYASRRGKECAKAYWDRDLSFAENAQLCGVRKIEEMPSGFPLEYRALYLPERKAVRISTFNYRECCEVMEEKDPSYSPDVVKKLLVLHELFHALEDSRGIDLEREFEREFGRKAGEEFRDAAAHSFANAVMEEKYLCQMIDYRWMEKYAPKELERRIRALAGQEGERQE